MKTLNELVKEQLNKCLETLRTIQAYEDTMDRCATKSSYAELMEYLDAGDKQRKYEGIFKKQVNAFAKFMGINRTAKTYSQAVDLLQRIETFAEYIQGKASHAIEIWAL